MFTLNCKGRLLATDTTLVMGIINITPDSFYAGSRRQEIGSIVAKAGKMLSEGADIIDIGGQSTRPGSQRITAKDEMARVLPAISAILEKFPSAILSVDTYHAAVAQSAVNAGAAIINDVSAGNMDPDMILVVAGLRVPYVCMHMKGTPEAMQANPAYENITLEILDFFIEKIDQCRLAGIKDIIIDPGFGFGKTIAQNFILLKEMLAFVVLDKPVMAGLSRKSTIWKTLGVSPEEALNGSTVMHTLALQNGASILRVHDVKEAKEAIILFQQYSQA